MAKTSTAKTDLIDAAVDLFRARGYEGVGVADLLAAAEAPRGSLYFHFPGGKEEIAVEAVRRFGDRGAAQFRALRESGVSLDEFIERTFKFLAKEAKAANFEIACPVIAIAADLNKETPELAAAVRQALSEWERECTLAAQQAGLAPEAAMEFASALVSTMEGATMTSKAHASAKPFLHASKAVKALAAQFARD